MSKQYIQYNRCLWVTQLPTKLGVGFILTIELCSCEVVELLHPYSQSLPPHIASCICGDDRVQTYAGSIRWRAILEIHEAVPTRASAQWSSHTVLNIDVCMYVCK